MLRIVAPGHLTNNISCVTSIKVFFLLSTSVGKTAIRLLSLKQQKYTKTRSATKYQPNLCRQPTRPSALRSCDKLDCTGRVPAIGDKLRLNCICQSVILLKKTAFLGVENSRFERD